MSTNISNYKMHVGDKGTTFQAIVKEELTDLTLAIVDLTNTDEQFIEIKRPGHDSDIFPATIVGLPSTGLLQYVTPVNTDSYLDQMGQIKWRAIVRVTATQGYFKGEWIVDKVNP